MSKVNIIVKNSTYNFIGSTLNEGCFSLLQTLTLE